MEPVTIVLETIFLSVVRFAQYRGHFAVINFNTVDNMITSDLPKLRVFKNRLVIKPVHV